MASFPAIPRGNAPCAMLLSGWGGNMNTGPARKLSAENKFRPLPVYSNCLSDRLAREKDGFSNLSVHPIRK